MTKFKKKPIIIEAFQWNGGSTKELELVLGLNWGRATAHDVAWGSDTDKEEVVIWNSLEDCWICCPVGHWIIRGIKGEFYPCENEVFEKSYELVPE